MPNIVTVDKLLFWLSKNWNVLFIGRHGVGKTSMVREAFIKAGIKYRMYSAATMDPWVDFIGVPKEMKNGDGEPYLGLVKPRDFQRGEVEAVFMELVEVAANIFIILIIVLYNFNYFQYYK